MKKLVATSLAFLLSISSAWAHVGPGTHEHGVMSHGLEHAIIDIGLIALSVGIIGLLLSRIVRNARGRPSRQSGGHHDH